MDSKKTETSEPKPPASVSTLAARLRRSRQVRTWSQQTLATRAGTSQAVIQKIENGKSLRPRNIVAIASALEVEPAWLMFGSNGSSPLSEEAIRVAKAWSGLEEPDRSAVRDNILRLAKHN
jgi:transcriptional regulator with XRE-family HTH domain